MADYEIFREQLALKYPSYGHALWVPSPRNPNRPVQVGDVGFTREGRFHRLFNALLPADHLSHEYGVPDDHEPLVPNLVNHLDTIILSPNNYCSAGVNVEPDPGYHSGPDDFRQVSFHCQRARRAAVLSLPVIARRENTLAQTTFRRWIVKHIDSWFAFAQNLVEIDRMEEIILVTGCDRTKSWTNIVFLGDQGGAQVSFGTSAEGSNAGVNFQFSPEHAQGAVVRQGPEGRDLPENECVFIRGFRVARSFWILRRRLKAAAGPSPDQDDGGPDMEVISIPAITKYRDPLHLLIDHIAERASDCDMIVAHDDDLLKIDGFGHGTSPESLEPDVMVDLLQRSNMEIQKLSCDLSKTGSGSNTDSSSVTVAMLSMTLQDRSAAPPSQSSLATQNSDLGHNESRGTPPPALPGNLPVPIIQGNTSNPTSYRDAVAQPFELSSLLIDGYVSRSFGPQQAEQYFCNILKSPSIPASCRFASDGYSFVATLPDQYPWVLDRRVVDGGTVIPQILWIPHTVTDRKQHVQDAELQKPIFFLLINGGIGLTLEAAVSGRSRTLLRNSQCHAPLGPQRHTYIRIGWRGYREFRRQIQIRDETPLHNAVTLSKFAQHVGRSVDAFLKNCQPDYANPAPQWSIGERGIQPHEIFIIGAIQVSSGSWMPILQLTRFIL